MAAAPAAPPGEPGTRLDPMRTGPGADIRTDDGASLPPLVHGLLRPRAYPHSADNLQLHETHISWVLLAGPFAYKLKKPVGFGFLDFTTRERRLADCLDEVRLNRRLCPDVYLGVVEVVEREGDYFVGGPGRPVEPAVWMRRLPASGMLPVLLAAGAADASLMRAIAERLARFHAAAATGPGVNEFGTPETVRRNWEENFAQTARFVGRLLSAETAAAIEVAVWRFLARERELLERRVAEGRVREGHGDLHAASICVEEGEVRLFDCLEFAPRFRCADVAAEVAFLAMDLDHYGRPDLARAFVEAYVRASGDGELWRLLPFYQCYRAYVRAKVLCFRLAETGLTPEAEARVEAQARSYFELARAYAERLETAA